eukprot:CAMPEP_0119102918 /NCGR_PEP_ID=MMETSP1180-20130426/1503_1 /TAXON_ID=3052 ORGANISM="Chlamydomonas cf sp, Strain CCMP681" /NCGR_SAMPLE_ID=MMETSP1180 /ASSEMBLY_ACC=CAM_ASM_000741 /LENGTH=129 /DNA_ID=CAMNT_0007087299 /DNA_START=232 /DNA_END=618 /DNA_ORIENTATION=+
MSSKDLENGHREPLLQPPDAPLPAATLTLVQVEHWSRPAARLLYSSLSNVGLSGFFGLVTAFGLRTLGQSVAIALVLLFIAVQVLAYYGFVNFQWRAVSSAMARRLDLNSDGRFDLQDVGVALRRIALW